MENYCGKRLDGRYEIREIIGVGGMAVVYKAYDVIDDRIVAIKILKEEFLANDEFRRRFKNESKAIAVLSHPNIVKVYDVSFGDRLQYIVMEYIEGITLKEYIEQQKVINWKEAVHFVTQILKALQHAHDKGIVHRDVKPQNIMLLQDGTIKVTDFGIARFCRGDTRTMTENAIGSVHYISPEQARGEITDDKADIYSVGVVMYEMLTGQLPFQSDSAVSVAIMQLQQEAKRPREINPDIPLGLEQITLRAMQKNPKDRYHSAAEMLVDLDAFRRNPSIKFDYDYFVDNEPTKFVDSKAVNGTAARQPVSAERRPAAPAVNGDDDKNDDEKPANKTVPILIGIIAGLVVIAAIVTGILLGRNVKKVEVPNFVGKNYIDDIMSNAEYNSNFKFETESVYSTDAEPGSVIKQTPDAGTKLRKGKTVKLQIAYNDDSVMIEGIIGLSSDDAEQKLKKAGFTTKIITSYQKNVTPGLVFDSYPTEGSYAEKGSLVTLYVSTDKNSNSVKVPSVEGYSADVAKQLIEAAGLKAKVTETDSDKPKGTVINQNPVGDSEADSGSTVEIVISSGTPASTTASVTVNLPNLSGSSTGTVKIYLNSDLYATYTDVLLNGGTKTYEISGKGANNKYTIFINDQNVQEGKIDFTQTPAKVSDVKNGSYDDKVALPNVVGKDVSEAKKTLETSGFTNVKVVDENGNSASSGKVESMSPSGGGKVSPSTEIKLVVKSATPDNG